MVNRFIFVDINPPKDKKAIVVNLSGRVDISYGIETSDRASYRVGLREKRFISVSGGFPIQTGHIVEAPTAAGDSITSDFTAWARSVDIRRASVADKLKGTQRKTICSITALATLNPECLASLIEVPIIYVPEAVSRFSRLTGNIGEITCRGLNALGVNKDGKNQLIIDTLAR